MSLICQPTSEDMKLYIIVIIIHIQDPGESFTLFTTTAWKISMSSQRHCTVNAKPKPTLQQTHMMHACLTLLLLRYNCSSTRATSTRATSNRSDKRETRRRAEESRRCTCFRHKIFVLQTTLIAYSTDGSCHSRTNGVEDLELSNRSGAVQNRSGFFSLLSSSDPALLRHVLRHHSYDAQQGF